MPLVRLAGSLTTESAKLATASSSGGELADIQASFADQNSECLFEIAAERDDACFVPSHEYDLSIAHIGVSEQAHDFAGHLWCAVLSGVRSCWSAIEKREPEILVMAMNHRTGARIGFVNGSVGQ